MPRAKREAQLQKQTRAAETDEPDKPRGDDATAGPPSRQAFARRRTVGFAPIRWLAATSSVRSSRARSLKQQTDADGSQQLLSALEQERERVAWELHDNLAQQISVLAIEVRFLQHMIGDVSSEPVQKALRNIQQKISRLSEETSQIARDLHPTSLTVVGIVPSLRELCREIERTHPVRVTFQTNVEERLTENRTAIVLFRIAQEALRNAVRHGQATHVIVSLQRAAGVVALRITDNGIGFDVAAALTKNKGLGLRSMNMRAAQIMGRATVKSRPHETIVEILVPLQDTERKDQPG